MKRSSYEGDRGYPKRGRYDDERGRDRQDSSYRDEDRRGGGYDDRRYSDGGDRYGSGGYGGGGDGGNRYDRPSGGGYSDMNRPSGGGYNDRPSGGGYSDMDRPSGGGGYNDRTSGGGYSDMNRPSGGGYSDMDRPSGGGGYNDRTSGGGGYNDRTSGGGYNDRPSGGGGYNDRPSGGYNDRPSGGGYSDMDRPSGGGFNDRPSGGGYSDMDRPSGGGYNDRPSGGSYNDRPSGRSYSDRPSGGSYSAPVNDRPSAGSYSDRPSGGSYSAPVNDRPSGGSYSDRPSGGSYSAPVNERPGYGGGNYSRGDYSSQGGDRRGGGDRFVGNRYGGRGGGRGSFRGGRGGGGRGGRERAPDMSDLKACLTNIVLAEVTEGFQFYFYSLSCTTHHGDQVESRHRRKFLFDQGFWDGILKDMPEKEKNDLRRCLFFSGSYFCCARPIPGFEASKLPISLPLGEVAEGEKIEIVNVLHYLAPTELITKSAPVGENEVKFDSRCSDCNKAFADQGALLQHCHQVGHKPVFIPDQTGANAPIPATIEVFISYVNGALQRALGERLARWGAEFIDPAKVKEPSDRNGNSLGVRVYEAFSCNFGVMKPGNGESDNSKVHLALTVDLRAKIVRTMSVLDHLCGRRGPNSYNPSFNEQEQARQEWIGQVVISMHDKKCYSVTDLIFDHSASSMPVEGLGMSHAEYFQNRKGVTLQYPDAKPMIAVLGRRNSTIYLPAELVAGNELERRVKEQLPQIASYKPEARNAAIENIRTYLVPGGQKTKGLGGLLPSLGIQIKNGRLSARAKKLPLPMMLAAGIQVPENKAENWAPLLNRASFSVNPARANILNVIVVYHERLQGGASQVYAQIRDYVNKYDSLYRFGETPFRMVKAGDNERHWGAVDNCLSDPNMSTENIFVLDFTKPRGSSDPAYPVIKQMLTKNGYLSQFVNFNTYSHDNPRDQKRSSIILQGVARQILHKSGVRLWWVKIPRSLPTPAVFVGVDVFHSPRVYDPVAKTRVAKASCAAIIVQVHRSGEDHRTPVEIYSETYAREPGKEYDLGDALKATVSRALTELNCDPKSCIVWRDGIGDSAFKHAAAEEIQGIEEGLNYVGPVESSRPVRKVPMSYIVCQKRIDAKFFSKGIAGHEDGKFGAPSGTLVEGIQGLKNRAFYINGRAPPYSTPKPVRFLVARQDQELRDVSLTDLTWSEMHNYPNWTGPIKVPSVCQMAHRLAELGGSLVDCGRNMDNDKLKNTVHFL